MDSVGIWAQVLYPNVAGFGNAQFLKYDDAELRLACVRAYNDWLIEWCSADPRRLLPVLATPFWDVEATVDEIERSASLGHRGILFTGEPQRFGMPPFGDPYWHPFWSTVQETGLPVSFHIGSGDLDLVQQAANKSYDGNIGRYGVKSTLDLYLNNAIQVVDLVLSGVLARYPGVRVVSVESGIGWVPFVLEALDHAAKSFKLATYAPEFEMPPSEYLRRQVSVCYFFEEFAPRHLVDAIGADNILFETDYPHPTCLYGNVRETIEAGLSDQPQEVRSKLLWGNSARLYHVDDPVVAKV
jgi:predicted TIM-barrel fold metal-dependent hydrolase